MSPDLVSPHDPASRQRRLLLCYVSGLDLRRVDRASTPFLFDSLAVFPWARLKNLPSNELFPTLVTGVSPAEHGVWGVKQRTAVAQSWRARAWSMLPDLLTTTIQGAVHLATGAYDLAAIPPRRRRHFEITRTKYQRRNLRREAMFSIGGVSTLFDVVGRGQSRYVFTSSPNPSRDVLAGLGTGEPTIELLELYSLDRYQQWNLDRPDAVREFYCRLDDFLRRLHEKCARSGVVMALVSDHGHEPIGGAIDLAALLRELPCAEDLYSCFVEVSDARFWFRDARAQQYVLDRLRQVEHARLLSYREMAEFGIALEDGRYGEWFLYLDPGWIFFPHDFHQPIANLWLGVVDPMQRSRLADPRHRGNHGHLPHFDTENAFLALLDPRFELVTDRGDILDVAPTILAAVGYAAPASMRGKPLIRPKSVA
jgi:hypothetical protein